MLLYFNSLCHHLMAALAREQAANPLWVIYGRRCATYMKLENYNAALEDAEKVSIVHGEWSFYVLTNVFSDDCYQTRTRQRLHSKSWSFKGERPL